ncbi:hypothetical protein D3C76_1857010 [compost metagenome]
MRLEPRCQQPVLGVCSSIISIRNLQQIPFEQISILLTAVAVLASGKLSQKLAFKLLKACCQLYGNA